MLIDDDVPVVEYLRRLVPWEELGMQVCAMAYSCSEAREVFGAVKPDILLTDIGLPDGSGIEMARALRLLRPGMRVVFLTCHEDFHYVQEALRIEADDYIVKDELTPEKMLQCLRRAADKVQQAQTDLEKMAYKSDFERNKDVLRQAFFQDILQSSDPESRLPQGKRLGVEWEGPYYSAALCCLDIGKLLQVYGSQSLDLVLYAVYNIAWELAAEGPITPFMFKASGLWLVLNTAEPGHAKEAWLTYLPEVRQKMNEFLRIDGYFLLHDEVGSLKELRRQIAQIKEQGTDHFYETTWLSRIPISRKISTGAKPDENRVHLEDCAGKWIRSLEDKDRPHVQLYTGTIEKLLLESKPGPAEALEFLGRMLQEAVYKLGVSRPEPVLSCLARSVRLGEAIRVIHWFSEQYLSIQEGTGQEDRDDSPGLKVINGLIHEHMQKNFTAIDAARVLHLNPSYFSRYFKKIAGVNFTDYVHLIKMEEAKRLLAEHNETAENVAYMLGYSDRAYFSKVFKKYTGKNPSDYKQH
jgi:two-component system response regulator YesN